MYNWKKSLLNFTKIGVKMRYYRLISGKTKLLYMTEALILSDLLNCTFIKKFNVWIIQPDYNNR